MNIVMAIGHALWMAFTMFWDIFWGLSLGFIFSAVIEVAISKGEMSRLLPDASAKSIVKASALGAASSSCSYAAVAMARSIVRKGGDFTAAMAFQFAATNLVRKHPISTVADDVDTREAGLLANGIDACGGGQQRSNVPR